VWTIWREFLQSTAIIIAPISINGRPSQKDARAACDHGRTQRLWSTVTIGKWAFIGYCQFTLSWFGQFGQTMGTGHYYFDEMKSSFNLVRNQLFALRKYLQNKLSESQQPNQQQYRKREREIQSPWNLGSLKHY
jgi:hypothetical protein